MLKILLLALTCSLCYGKEGNRHGEMIERRHVFKMYTSMDRIKFKDGHFIIMGDSDGKKLKTIRADNGGVYYVPYDICKNKKLHHTHH